MIAARKALVAALLEAGFNPIRATIIANTVYPAPPSAGCEGCSGCK